MCSTTGYYHKNESCINARIKNKNKIKKYKNNARIDTLCTCKPNFIKKVTQKHTTHEQIYLGLT